MAVPALEPAAMVDADLQAAACVPRTGEHDPPAARRADAIAGLAIDVDALVEAVLGLVFPESLGDRSDQRPAPGGRGGRGAGGRLRCRSTGRRRARLYCERH